MADQLLVFDGHGHITVRHNSNNEANLRHALSTFTSPIELNPEEEDHKQLAAILRSRRIRDSLVIRSSKPETTKSDRDWQSLAFIFRHTAFFTVVVGDCCCNLIVGAGENFPGMPAAMRRYSAITNSG